MSGAPAAARPVADPVTDLVVTGVGLVEPEGFDFRAALGRRGYKYLPVASQYFLAAAKRAMAHTGADTLEPVAPDRRAAVVGTNSAAAALHAEMDRAVVESGADELSPVLAPYFSINLFGSRLATEYELKGFNLTFTSPRVAGIEALHAGQRAVAAGRAGWLLAGATEAALDYGEPGVETSEAGAVALVLEPAATVAARGGRALGRVAARSFFLPPRTAESADGAGRAAGLIGGALRALGHGGGGLPVTAVLDDSFVGEAVAAALDGHGPVTRVPARAGCLEPVLRIAAALGGGAGAPCAVVTAAAEGNVAVCLIGPAGTRTRAVGAVGAVPAVGTMDTVGAGSAAGENREGRAADDHVT